MIRTGIYRKNASSGRPAAVRTVILTALALTVLVRLCSASVGLSSPFTECVLDSVEPGREYFLTTPRGVPYIIKNISDSQIGVEIIVSRPVESELRNGYSRIPDTGWITVRQRELTLEPGEWKQIEVVLKVPAGREHRGKSYQANISAGTTGGLVRPAVGSSVLFTVSERKGFFRRIFWFLR